MRHLLAAGPARWAPCPHAGVPAPLARHPSPHRPAACGAGTLKNPGTAAQAAHGEHSPIPKIPGIHRELPGPIHIAAIRPPASF
jgi:hypothetical protein